MTQEEMDRAQENHAILQEVAKILKCPVADVLEKFKRLIDHEKKVTDAIPFVEYMRKDNNLLFNKINDRDPRVKWDNKKQQKKHTMSNKSKARFYIDGKEMSISKIVEKFGKKKK